MLAKLRRATISFFEGYGLSGFLEVEQDGGQGRIYSFRLPTPEEPQPPGWASIERLTKVTSAEVCVGWDPTRTSNPVAERAIVALSSQYGGERFVVTESQLPDGRVAAEIVPLDPGIAAPRRLASVAVTVEKPVTYTTCFHISVADGNLVLHISGVADALWPRFKIPTRSDRTPDDWWFIETFTGVAHERIAAGWSREGNNPVLDDTLRLLAQVLEKHNAFPLRVDGSVDLHRWRRELVRARMRLNVKPFVFLGRPDHTIEHTRAVFYDATGDFLFRANAEPGKAHGVPAMVVDADGKAMLLHVDDKDALRGVLNRSIRFARTGRPPKPADPPDKLLVDLVRYPDLSWPIIKGIVRIPTVREDGTIITSAGFDRSTGLWYAPEFELDPIPDQPTLDDVARARALLLTPIAEFPYVNEGARTAALASLFEQVVRPMIKGPRPLYVFDAPEQGQGAGKTTLAKIFQVILTGADPMTTALGQREEEIEKRLTSILRSGEIYIILDNLVREVVSQALQQLATSERWQARLLGVSDSPIYYNLATFVLTLNGAKANKDIRRRMVLAQLDPKTSNAHERTGFTIKEEDLIPWVRERRAALVRACLLLVRHWIVAGRPEDPTVVRGSFGGWCRVIGGLMKHSGFGGLADALKASSDRDVHSEDHRLFIGAWIQEIPLGQPVPAMTLGQLALKVGLYDEKLPKKGSPLAVGKAMASILRSALVGQAVDGYTVSISPAKQNGYTTYVLHTAPTLN